MVREVMRMSMMSMMMSDDMIMMMSYLCNGTTIVVRNLCTSVLRV